MNLQSLILDAARDAAGPFSPRKMTAALLALRTGHPDAQSELDAAFEACRVAPRGERGCYKAWYHGFQVYGPSGARDFLDISCQGRTVAGKMRGGQWVAVDGWPRASRRELARMEHAGYLALRDDLAWLMVKSAEASEALVDTPDAALDVLCAATGAEYEEGQRGGRVRLRPGRPWVSWPGVWRRAFSVGDVQ